MADFPYRCALIIGAGPGISASLARRLSNIGLQIGLAARDVCLRVAWHPYREGLGIFLSKSLAS
jgi:NADP-dependent 3-hydroxy acid dehydrogenase YdfG